MGTDPPPSAAAAPARWAGFGQATDHGDPVAAAHAAVRQAVRPGDAPALLIAFATAGPALPALASALQGAAPGVPVVGASTSRPLAPPGADLVVVALGGCGFAVSTVAIEGAADDLRGAGIEAAAALGDVADRDHHALLLLADAGAGDQHELVRGAYSIAGAGVCLIGSTTRRPGVQLHGGRALTGAVVAAAIGSDAPFGVGVAHGWEAIGQPLHVTRTDGADLLTLDGRPALDAYLERTDAPAGLDRDAAAFARHADAHPLGVRLRAQESHVRLVLGADLVRRSLRTSAELPQGGLAWMMGRDDRAVARAAQAGAGDAIRGLAGRPPLALVTFGELGTLAPAGAPSVGLSGAGEIARARGSNAFHNHAHAVLAIA